MKVLTASGGFAPIDLAAGDLRFVDGTDVVSSGTVPLIPGPDGQYRTVSYTNVYRSNPWLWAAIQLKARGYARMPMKLYRRHDDDSRERIRPDLTTIEGSLAYRLKHPVDGRSWQAQNHATEVDRRVHGNAVIFVERDRRGRFLELRRVPFRFVGHEKIAGVDRYWDVRRPGSKRLRDDIIHHGADQDCDDHFGPSPIASMKVTLALYDAIGRHLVGFFKNSARPSGMIELDRQATKAQRKVVSEAVRQLVQGPDNAGRVLVTSGKWHDLSHTVDHSKVIELIKLCREEIVATVGVPGPLVGILDRAIMSNVRELRSFYGRDVMGPDIALYEGDYCSQLIEMSAGLADTDLYAEVDMDVVLRPDLEARAKSWRDQRYMLTLNEMRSRDNMPRIDHPDADRPWMPLSEAPLGGSNAPGEDSDDDDDDGGENRVDPGSDPDDDD